MTEIESRVKQLEKSALMFTTSSMGADADTQKNLQYEIDFVTEAISLIKAGAVYIYQSETVQDALEKCKTDILDYCKKLNDRLFGLEEELNTVNFEENQYNEYMRETTAKRNDKQSELRNTSFFDFNRKKELKIEISELKVEEPPYNFEWKKNDISERINKIKDKLKPLENKIKSLISCIDQAQVSINKANNVNQAVEQAMSSMQNVARKTR